MLPMEADTHLRVRQLSLDLSSPNHIPLNVRIAEFCEDPQSMDQMTEFVDDILKTAQIEADARLGRGDKVCYLQCTINLGLNFSIADIFSLIHRLRGEKMEKVKLISFI